MLIGPETTVAEIVTHHPATIRVFQRYGIDFCCGGKRALRDVCEDGKVSLLELQATLGVALVAPHEPSVKWQEVSLGRLIAHILERYHRPLDEELPRLAQMMQKVVAVHGDRHPELRGVAETLAALGEDLWPHMMKEERVLFPYLFRLEALAAAGTPLLASPFGTVESPITVMESEHEAVGQLLATLRGQTGDYTAPADACATFQGLYHGFAELERELHEHIHLENNILFPRAKALEAERLKAQPDVRAASWSE